MTTANGTETVIVDDSDTDRIIYSDNWRIGGMRGEFNQTTHGTTSSSAFCIFIFNGTSVAVFGTIVTEQNKTVSTYALDNDPIQTFLSPATTTSIVQAPFYQSNSLADTTHTLVITGGKPFWLDYILYTTIDPLSGVPTASSNTSLVNSTSTIVSPASPAVGPTSVITSTPPSRTPTSTKPAPLPTVISKSQRPVGAIIGGILGGAVFLLAAALLFLRFRRYKSMTITGHSNDSSR